MNYDWDVEDYVEIYKDDQVYGWKIVLYIEALFMLFVAIFYDSMSNKN